MKMVIGDGPWRLLFLLIVACEDFASISCMLSVLLGKAGLGARGATLLACYSFIFLGI